MSLNPNLMRPLLFFVLDKFMECGENFGTDHPDLYKLLTDNTALHNTSDIFISNDDLQEYLNFIDKIRWPVKNVKINQEYDLKTSDKPKFYKCVKEIYIDINKYIRKNVSEQSNLTYISRLNMIYETIKTIQKQNIEDKEVFSSNTDKDFTRILNNLMLKNKNRLRLDNESYKHFLNSFNTMLKKIKERYPERYGILQMNIANRKNLHLREFMKIYKYVKVFPELLLLGYAATKKCLKKVTIPLHFITLFMDQNHEKLLENKTLAIFLIKMVFSYTRKNKLDLIFVFKTQESNPLEISKLYFFNCEFNSYQRRNIKTRIKSYDDLTRFFFEEDRIHNNIVLRLLLFQHLIYLKYKNVESVKLENFISFINTIFEEKGCYFNQFYRFINSLQ